jgi:hypothetical protein
MGGDKKALGAGLWAAWLLCVGCADAEASSGDDTWSGPAPTSTCPKEKARCSDLCSRAEDCDHGKGGHVCWLPDPQTMAAPVKRVTDSADVRRPANAQDASSASDSTDAGEDSDAGPDEVRHMPVPQALGSCARACSTALCSDPQAVCSSHDGFCRPGCDDIRPSCGAGQACDFVSKRCMDLDAHCVSVNDCAVFDRQLTQHGVVSCEDQRCRYRLNSLDSIQPLRSSIPNDDAHTLNVQAPLPGQRIKPVDVASFPFQFDVPAQVIVAAVLTRPIKSLEDGAAAAVWTAYLDQGAALRGVTLAAGGENRDGEWQRYADDATPVLPIDKQLYFFVLGYERGQLVAQSELVPFSVGEARIQPGAACIVPGAFCPNSGLLCADDYCRTPCLSDDDCAAEGRSCSEPGMSHVAARLCL